MGSGSDGFDVLNSGGNDLYVLLKVLDLLGLMLFSKVENKGFGGEVFGIYYLCLLLWYDEELCFEFIGVGIDFF